MSVIRLYLDEDAAQHGLLAALRLRGVDVTSAQEVGLISAPDQSQLEWTQQAGRVLYTFNVGDFRDLHREFLNAGKDHPGIILAPQQRYTIGGQMRCLLRLIAARSAEDMRNRIEFLSNWQALRIAVLVVRGLVVSSLFSDP